MAANNSKAAGRNHFGSAASAAGTAASAKSVVDRQKVCPFLLRVFLSTSRHNNLVDYNRGKVPTNELQIYTWSDASLKELTSLVREVHSESRQKGTYFDISRVFPVNNRGGGISGPNGVFCHYNMREIGTTVSGKKGVDDSKTLKDAAFEIGDYLDISVTPPTPGSGAMRDRAGRGDLLGGRDHRRGGFGRRERGRRPY